MLSQAADVRGWNGVPTGIGPDDSGYWPDPMASPARLARSLPAQTLLLAAVLFLYHLALQRWMTTSGERLGRIGAQMVAPLHAEVDVRIGLWLVPALVVLGSFLILARRLILRTAPPAGVLLAVSVVYFIVIGLSVAMIDAQEVKGKPRQPIIEPYSRTEWEYYGDVPTVDRVGGPASFLARYARPRLFTTLSLHAQTHPPGAVLFLWLVSKAFGYNLWSASLATVAFTALIVFPVFGLARELAGEAVARCALAFLLVAPNLVMFTTTSMDGPFSVLPVTSVYLFYRALGGSRPAVYAALCGLALAGAAFMTYAAVFIALFYAVVAVLDRDRFAAVARTLAVALAAFLAAYALLFVTTGYEPVAAARAAMAHDAEMMGTGHESFTRYLNLSVANLLVFLIGVGVPLTTCWLRELAVVAGRRLGAGDVFVVAFSVSLVLIAFSSLFTLEVERIWLLVVPFVAIAAARQAVELMKTTGRAFSFDWVAGLTALQLVVFEALLQTAW